LPKRPVVSPSDVFINLPFDLRHERLFLALIAGLVALGLNPRCVLEVPPSTDRLRRLYSLVRACPFVREFRATLRSSVYRANAFRKIVVAARLFAGHRAIEAGAGAD
jgi:hypothetical protein